MTRPEPSTNLEYIELKGARVPRLGLGTWQLQGESCTAAVAEALELGYRHVDTAQMYENELDVGLALRKSPVPRDALWLTTKLGRGNLSAPGVRASTEESLTRLGVDYLDLLLVHWPGRLVPLAETLDAMQDLVDRELVRYLGVSNFTPRLLDEALSRCQIVTNQVEYHPFLSQDRLLAMCRAAGIGLTAYCPLARGRVLNEPVVQEIARTRGKSPAQVVLRWLLGQPAVLAVPKAGQARHARENLEIFDFELSHEEIRSISFLLTEQYRIVNPTWAPDWES